MSGKPDAEIELSEDLLRQLLTSQHPDLADLPLTRVASGWDNEVYRLGDSMAMRMPRRQRANVLSKNEQQWMPLLAKTLPLPIPAPLRHGEPDSTYPWTWSIVPWFEGKEADIAPPDASTVPVFAHFLQALHVAAPQAAPRNDLRGVDLRTRADAASERMVRLKSRLGSSGAAICPRLEHLWEQGLAAPLNQRHCWLHGDLHAQNVLTSGGQIEAVIDWGDMTAGDPATDLASVWSLYADQNDRERLLDLYSPDEATLARARAWAAWFVVILIDTGMHNSPRHERQGRAMLSRLLADV